MRGIDCRFLRNKQIFYQKIAIQIFVREFPSDGLSDGSFSVKQFCIFCGTETTSLKQSSFSTPGVSPNNFEPLQGKTVDLGNRLSLIASV